MGKRLFMGGDVDPGTIDLTVGTIIGVGSTLRHDDNGNVIPGQVNSAPVGGLRYIIATAENIAALVGVDGNDVLLGSDAGDLIVWEHQLTGLGGPRHILPSGGDAAIDVFDMGAGDDVVNLTYINDGNPSTPDDPYTANAVIDGGTGNDVIFSGAGNDSIFGGGGSSSQEILFGGAGNDVIVGNFNAFNQIGGDSGNDELYGGVRTDAITGGTGDDTAFGGSGNDFVDGEAGNDTLFGGGDNDNLMGGDGNDTVFGETGDDAVDGGGGFLDTLYGGAGNDHITDFDGARLVYGDADNDRIEVSYLASWNEGVPTLFGGSGSDTIAFTGAQNSTINIVIRADETTGVGDGNDIVSMRGSYAGATTSLGGGNDVYEYIAFAGSNGSRSDTVYGGAGADTISTGAGIDVLYGDAGNDVLQGGAGADTMYGGSDIDVISYSTSAAGITMGLTGVAGIGGDAQGDVAWTDIENLIGSEHADSLYGNASANTILGLGGNDTIEGLGGADSLDGGGGVNWLSYANSDLGVNISFFTGTGSGGHADGDVVANFQNLIGSGFDDVLTGGIGSNVIQGGAGVDTIEGREGADSLFGGGNGDFLSYAGSDAGVTVSLLANTASGGHATGDVFTGFRHLIGSDFGDTLTGDAQANSISGGAGVDTIEGGAGGDVMFGGGNGDWLSYAGSTAGVTVDLAAGIGSGGDATGDSFAGFQNLIGSGQADRLTGSAAANTINGGGGNDTVEGGGGADSLIGGAGIDELSYAHAPSSDDDRAGVTVTLGSGTGVGSDAQGDTNTGFENLTGSEFFDTLTGDGGANVISGLGGFDRILGGGGNDTLYGGVGNDTLAGEAGFDTLFGGDGMDWLQLNSDGTVGGGGITVAGWDGEAGSGPINVAVAAGAALYGDTAFGGLDQDTLDLSGVSNASPRTAYFSANANISQLLAGVEIILAGTAADVINLTFNDGVTRSAYAENVTIFGGANADVVFSGSGNDLIVGGRAAGIGGGESGDTLYGGAGNDTIVGDDLDSSLFGGADLLYGGQGDDTIAGGIGGDTLYGGAGIDSLDGGTGDDLIFDSDGASFISGGMGADLIVVNFANPAFVGSGGDQDGEQGGVPIVIYGGNNQTLEEVDGDDRVFVSGTYDEIVAGLGFGNDLYISSTGGGGLLRDLVSGQDGTDVISTWQGDDQIDGGSGNDALWGGAGSDTIYGGPGTDYLYGGAGNGDVLVGGAGVDYYYWSRTDGNDLIDDADPDRLPGTQGENYIVVFPAGDPNESGPTADWLLDGSGVVETDRDLYDNDGDDMVQLVDLDGDGPGTMYELRILQGAGAGSVLTFDQTEISAIALWNNDAATGTPVITVYAWDEDAGRYLYQG